jgi:hypothetical protein
MVEGCAGTLPEPLIVTAMVRAVPVTPQTDGVTLMVPPAVPAVTVMLLLVPPAVFDQSLGSTQS